MALITPAQVRTHYPSLVGTGEDTRLTEVIAQVDGLLAAYCGYPVTDAGVRTLEDATYTVHLGEPMDPSVLVLPHHPIVSVTTVHVDPGLTYDADTLVDAGDYVVDTARGEIVLPSSSPAAWSTTARANRVVYVAGFSSTPGPLVALAAMAVRDVLDRGQRGDQLSGSSSRQSFSRAASTHALSEAVRAGLSGYVLWGSRAG